MLSATLAEAILEKHKSKSKERQQEKVQANETAQKALVSIEKEQKEVDKKKLQDKVKLMQSWDIDRKIRKLEKKVEKKGDKTYHKIVFGQTDTKNYQTESQGMNIQQDLKADKNYGNVLQKYQTSAFKYSDINHPIQEERQVSTRTNQISANNALWGNTGRRPTGTNYTETFGNPWQAFEFPQIGD